jgi:hypothetical protein
VWALSLYHVGARASTYANIEKKKGASLVDAGLQHMQSADAQLILNTTNICSPYVPLALLCVVKTGRRFRRTPNQLWSLTTTSFLHVLYAGSFMSGTFFASWDNVMLLCRLLVNESMAPQ